MRVIGPETDDDRELREWFEAEQRKNLERLDSGATTVVQLVTGLYGVLFAVLALKDAPTYLERLPVRLAGSLSVAAYFVALLAALFVVLPRSVPFQKDNLSEMRRASRDLLDAKAGWLRAALILFMAGTAGLGIVIAAVLWGL